MTTSYNTFGIGYFRSFRVCVCVQNHVCECLLLKFVRRPSQSAYASECLLYVVMVIGHYSLQLPSYGVDCFYRKGG